MRHKLEYSDVDMRVGVHSGKVLGGVIGQRQWQYDVMSHEVNVANAMETYGVPGRVHISCAVLKQLDDNFELEERPTPEALVCHNMKSYLVGKILKKVTQLVLYHIVDYTRSTKSTLDIIYTKF